MGSINDDFSGFFNLIKKSLYCEIIVLDKKHELWSEFYENVKITQLDKKEYKKAKEYTWVILTLYQDDFEELTRHMVENYLGDLDMEDIDQVLDFKLDGQHLILTEFNTIGENKPEVNVLREYELNLNLAVKQEDYKKAAQLRDKISDLKKKIKS